MLLRQGVLLLGAVGGVAAQAPKGTYCCRGGSNMLAAFGAAGGCGPGAKDVGVAAMSVDFSADFTEQSEPPRHLD